MRNSNSVIKVLLLTLALLLLVASQVAADFSQRDWRYVKAIMLPAGLQTEGLVELVPDSEVFTGALRGLADLRIIDGDNEEVAYKLEVSKAQSERTSFPVSLQDKGYVPGSCNIFTADLGKEGILHNEIEIRITSSNFRRTATVETSKDGDIWMMIADAIIYDFTVKERGFTTRNTSIRYPESTARYVRVTIATGGEGPLNITGATIYYVKETPPKEISHPASILDISSDDTRNTTSIEIDLGTPGLPSYRLAIDVPDINFHRDVTLQLSTDRKQWNTIRSGAEIYAYDTPKFVGSSLAITYNEITSRYLRLTIEDEDNPPLTIEGAKVWGPRYRLVFTVEPQQSYNLYYGNDRAQKPSYDIERIFPYLVTEQLPEATLDSQTANPEFEEEKPPVSERFPWLFPVVIVVAVIVVALILIGILRQARKVLPPPEE